MQETATVRDGELRLNLELRRGLPVAAVDRRLQEACRGKDLCSRALGFYFADLEDRGAHAELGFKSVSELARMRLRMAPSTANEYKTVSRGLDQLPHLEAAFAREELCWSQVRLLSRVAIPQTDEQWVTYAKSRRIAWPASTCNRRA